MKTTHTQAEKNQYFAALRNRWKAAKAATEAGDYSALYLEAMATGITISQTGFSFVAMQMRAQNLPGLPYIDAKTYAGWKDSGFQVKKGEKSTLSGLTWIKARKANQPAQETGSDSETNAFTFPKEYHLFHRSQVEELQIVPITPAPAREYDYYEEKLAKMKLEQQQDELAF